MEDICYIKRYTYNTVTFVFNTEYIVYVYSALLLDDSQRTKQSRNQTSCLITIFVLIPNQICIPSPQSRIATTYIQTIKGIFFFFFFFFLYTQKKEKQYFLEPLRLLNFVKSFVYLLLGKGGKRRG